MVWEGSSQTVANGALASWAKADFFEHCLVHSHPILVVSPPSYHLLLIRKSSILYLWMSDTSSEEQKVEIPLPWHKDPKKAPNRRQVIIVASAFAIVVSPFMIWAVMANDSMFDSDLVYNSKIAGYLASVVGFISGIVGLVAGVTADRDSVQRWTIAFWALFGALFIDFCYLLSFGSVLLGPIICASVFIAFHLISCICIATMNREVGLESLPRMKSFSSGIGSSTSNFELLV